MRICTISFHCCPFSSVGGDGVGGMNIYLRELSSALAPYPNVKIDIFTRLQHPGIWGIREISPQVQVIHLKGGPEHSVDRTKLSGFVPEFVQNLEKFIIQQKRSYDLVYTHYWLSGLVGEALKAKHGIPLVHTYHTLSFLKKRVLRKEDQSERIQTERNLAFVSDAIISSSSEEKQNIVREYRIPASRVQVVYPGVNESLFFYDPDPKILEEAGCLKNDKILLYVGRIEPIKGLMTVMDALEVLREKNRHLFNEIKLVVIGGGEKNLDLSRNREVRRIKQTAERKSLRNQVVFLGSKNQEELRKYYSAADALVVPSLYESFGLVVVEALACGTPVIVSQIGKMRTIVKDGKNGFSFQLNDPESLAACLKHFFLHKNDLWMKERIRQDVVRKFSWEKTASLTYKTFSELLRHVSCPTTIFQRGEMLQPA